MVLSVQVGWFVGGGNECTFGGGGWCKIASALGDRRVCVEVI